MNKSHIKRILKQHGHNTSVVNQTTKTITLKHKPEPQLYSLIRGYTFHYKRNELKTLLSKLGYHPFTLTNNTITIHRPPTLELCLATKGYNLVVKEAIDD